MKVRLERSITVKLRCGRCGLVFEKTFKDEKVGGARFSTKCPRCRSFIHVYDSWDAWGGEVLEKIKEADR